MKNHFLFLIDLTLALASDIHELGKLKKELGESLKALNPLTDTVTVIVFDEGSV